MDFSVKLGEAKELLSAPESCIKQVQGEVVVLVHPKYATNIKEGISAELNSKIKRYSKELNGIPMAYENIKLLSPHAWLFDTNPFSHIVVRATFFVFMPEIGNILEAVVKKKSKFHIGCLVHGMFNVSVPKPLEMNLDDWCGVHLQEGDSVKLKVTDMNMTGFLPYIKGDLDPDSIQELIDARKLEMSKQEDKTQNSRIVFDDSGISSNEVDEPVDDTKTKKKKKKKDVSSKELEIKEEAVSSSEELNESTINESDITEKKKKKKKKKRECENHSENEANESLISENNDSPKKKKKKKKKEKDDEFFDSLLNDEDIKSEEDTGMATPEDMPMKVKKEKAVHNSTVNEEELDNLLDDGDFKLEESIEIAVPEDSPVKVKKEKKKKKKKEDNDISFSDMDTSVVKEEELDTSGVREKKKKKKRALEDTLNESIKREFEEVEINFSSIDVPDLEEADSPRPSKKRKAEESISGSVKRRKKNMI